MVQLIFAINDFELTLIVLMGKVESKLHESRPDLGNIQGVRK